MAKKIYSTGVAHPAVYSVGIMPVLGSMLDPDRHRLVLDPFAGVGKIHNLSNMYDTIGVELEPEWAHVHERTIVGNALDMPFADATFDAICTSPTYGNRFADKHKAKDGSERRSYTHDLGRDLHPDNSGGMQWGPEYQRFHMRAWREVLRTLKPGGRFVLNISDHIRKGERQYVSDWHIRTLQRYGCVVADVERVKTQRFRQGSNSSARVDSEMVIALDYLG